MKLIEINEIIEGKYKGQGTLNRKRPRISKADVTEFMQIISIDDIYFQSLQSGENSREFYKAYSFLGQVVDHKKQEELYYAAKLGYFFEGVSTRLTYILQKALALYDTPNCAISAVDKKIWKRYLQNGSLSESITIKNIMENILGEEFDTVLSYRRRVKWKDTYEIYVENVDRIVVLPDDLGRKIESREDLEHIHYEKSLGVCLYNEPLRFMGGRVGITSNDFDLRKSI